MTTQPLPARSSDDYEYVATAPINIHGVRAFNPGDPVPAEHVASFDIAGSVAKRGTADADLATRVFDPSDHNVTDVNAYLVDPATSQAERERVVAAERAGRARVTIVGTDE